MESTTQEPVDNYDARMVQLAWLTRMRWIPGFTALALNRYETVFRANRKRNLFRGVFFDRQAALASAPENLPQGYDNAESAAMYFGLMDPDPYDYPAMLWMERAFNHGMRSVMDVGGHIGIKYYAFNKLMTLPADMRWTVCDVPAVIQRGQNVAAKRDPAKLLHFTSDYAAVEGVDLLFASGVIQYLPMSLEQWLTPIKQRPKRIIINTAAIHSDKDFFTLNSIGTAYCPYRITSEKSLLTQLQGLGYQKIDHWKTPGKGSMSLPFNPELNIAEYSGYVFDLT